MTVLEKVYNFGLLNSTGFVQNFLMDSKSKCSNSGMAKSYCVVQMVIY